MSNLTVNIEDQLIKRARVRAIQQGTSLSAKVREFLSSYAAGTSQQTAGDATVDLLRMIDEVRNEANAQRAEATDPTASSGMHRTLRDVLYEGDHRSQDRMATAQLRTNNNG